MYVNGHQNWTFLLLNSPELRFSGDVEIFNWCRNLSSPQSEWECRPSWYVLMSSLCQRSVSLTIKIYGCHREEGNIPHHTQYWGNWIHWWRDLSGSTFKQFILHQLQGRGVSSCQSQSELFFTSQLKHGGRRITVFNVVQTDRLCSVTLVLHYTIDHITPSAAGYIYSQL